MPNDTLERILLPTYDLSLYAIDHWMDHLQALSTAEKLDENEEILPLESIRQKLGSLARICEENVIDQATLSAEKDMYSASLEATWQLLNVEPWTKMIIDKYIVQRGDRYLSGTITENSKHFNRTHLISTS